SSLVAGAQPLSDRFPSSTVILAKARMKGGASLRAPWRTAGPAASGFVRGKRGYGFAQAVGNALGLAFPLSGLRHLGSGDGAADMGDDLAGGRQGAVARPDLEGAFQIDRHDRHLATLRHLADAGQEALQMAVRGAPALREPDQRLALLEDGLAGIQHA